MKVENVREVKARLNRLIKDLPRSGSILITRNGKACAALLPVTEDTDLETLVLSASKRFWQIMIPPTAARKKKDGPISTNLTRDQRRRRCLPAISPAAEPGR